MTRGVVPEMGLPSCPRIICFRYESEKVWSGVNLQIINLFTVKEQNNTHFSEIYFRLNNPIQLQYHFYVLQTSEACTPTKE